MLDQDIVIYILIDILDHKNYSYNITIHRRSTLIIIIIVIIKGKHPRLILFINLHIYIIILISSSSHCDNYMCSKCFCFEYLIINIFNFTFIHIKKTAHQKVELHLLKLYVDNKMVHNLYIYIYIVMFYSKCYITFQMTYYF